MNEEQKQKLQEELANKSHDELVEIIVKCKDDISFTNSFYKHVSSENDRLKKSLEAIRSIINIINI